MADLTGVRVVRWERTYSPSGPIIRLAFTSPYTEAFASACAEVRALPLPERAWIPRERCWHLTIAGARALARRWPLVAQLLAAEDAGGDAQYAHNDECPGASVHPLLLTRRDLQRVDGHPLHQLAAGEARAIMHQWHLFRLQS